MTLEELVLALERLLPPIESLGQTYRDRVANDHLESGRDLEAVGILAHLNTLGTGIRGHALSLRAAIRGAARADAAEDRMIAMEAAGIQDYDLEPEEEEEEVGPEGPEEDEPEIPYPGL